MKYAEIPEFGQHVEYVTQATPVGDVCGVIINRVDISQLPVVEAAETIKADYEKASALRPLETLAAEKVEAVKAEVCKTYHTDVADYVTQDADPLHIMACVAEVKSYPEWKSGIAVKIDQVYLYKTNLYRVVQAHTTQSDWTPDITKSLFVKFHDPAAGYPEWEQPTGAHDAYRLGVKVTYKGHLWENISDYNVYAPDVWGWKDLGVYP